MPIGAHVSTSGGLSTAVGRAQAIGAECTQVHLCAPQRWKEPVHSPEEIASYRQGMAEAGIGPNFAHAIYLINMASTEPILWQRSVDALIACAGWAERCGMAGVVVHVGSSKDQPLEEAERNVVAGLAQVLRATPGGPPILLENSAGSGNTLGARFVQLGKLLDGLGRDQRVGMCLDTAHTFASGYDVRTADGLAQALAEIDQHVGLERLAVIHANDSKAPLGGAVDRHENIGQGQIGRAGFERMLGEPRLAALPWVLEVPGADKKGPDAENVKMLRRLAGLAVD